jgi:hypothetical protein
VTASTRPQASSTPSSPTENAGTLPRRRWGVMVGLARLAALPAVAWIAGGSTLAVFGLAALAWVYWPSPVVTDAKPAQKAAAKADAAPSPAPAAGAAAGSHQPNAQPRAQPTTTTGRMARLGELLAAYRLRKGYFPTGTVAHSPAAPSERLSWLATLMSTVMQPDAPPPLWNEPWSSPRNERFVRQSIPEFLNPSVQQLVGPQSYPATHFVGVAGVGEDAPGLPVEHPRAGVFGNDRITRLDDIRDGASNTLMVLGVTSNLGSWAAGGSATIRPLTHEPYVNGPDGFGTGSPDRMIVLMADGGVRELSSKTDPRLIRRMACINDGLPLDLQVPGEPGDGSHHPWPQPPAVVKSTPIKMVERSPVVAPRPAAVSATAPAKPPAARPTVDIAAGLRQPIVRFQQSRPARLRDVLTILEEMVSAPVRADQREIGDLDDLMETPVEFDLQNTTVGDVLTAVLAKAKLAYVVEPDCIRLRKFATAPTGGSVP